METLKHIWSDGSFDDFCDSVLKKKKAFNGNIGGPNLKLKTQASSRFAIGRAPDEHPTIPRDN